MLGVHTVPVLHRLDDSVVWLLYPCHSKLRLTIWTDGGWDSLGPFKIVIVRSSWPFRWLDGYLRMKFSGWNFHDLIINVCCNDGIFSGSLLLPSLPSRRSATQFKNSIAFKFINYIEVTILVSWCQALSPRVLVSCCCLAAAVLLSAIQFKKQYQDHLYRLHCSSGASQA